MPENRHSGEPYRESLKNLCGMVGENTKSPLWKHHAQLHMPIDLMTCARNEGKEVFFHSKLFLNHFNLNLLHV